MTMLLPNTEKSVGCTTEMGPSPRPSPRLGGAREKAWPPRGCSASHALGSKDELANHLARAAAGRKPENIEKSQVGANLKSGSTRGSLGCSRAMLMGIKSRE
jgi:hypothetical protein